MDALQLPFTLFKTRNIMNDFNASDMRCGDLSAEQLKTRYRLDYISDRVDPWTLTRRSSMSRPQSMFYNTLSRTGDKISLTECANILFDELRQLSGSFSLYGPYKHLIVKMINHMQRANGAGFSDVRLNTALTEQIIRDSTEKSTRLLLKFNLDENIDFKNKIYPEKKFNTLREIILTSKLPKFDRLQDNFNGMGITVHDTWATHIILKSLDINNNGYSAIVHYKVQDHFGLDDTDVLNKKFSQFHFFRIWFVLQRYKLFGFKPFLTNMESLIEIKGSGIEK